MKVPTSLRVFLSTVVRVLLVPMLVAISVGAACGGDDATKGPLESLKPDDFPNKPIDILVGYDAGGGSDQWARSIARAAEEVLGVQVTVTNLVGNGGLDALDRFMSAPADGYSLLSIIDVYVAAYAAGETEINPAEDLVPLLVGNVVVSQIYMAANEERFSSWNEAVAYGKDNQGLTVASAGSPMDLEGLSIQGLEDDFGLDLERVFLSDSQARFNAAVDGTTDLLIEQPSDVVELVDAGEIVPILTLWDQRVKGSEDVPTATELGAEFPPLLRLRGLAAHKQVSQERLAYLEAALREAFNSQEFQDGLKERSMDLVEYPEDATAAFKEQVDAYEQLYAGLPTARPVEKIKAIAPSSSAVVLAVKGAMDAGIFEKWGFELDLEVLPFSEYVASFANRDVEVSIYSGATAIRAIANEDMPWVIIGGGLTVMQNIYVPVDSDIQTVEDLKGKKLGIFSTTGGAVEALRIVLLEEANLDIFDEDQVELVVADAPALFALAEKGEVDAQFQLSSLTIRAASEPDNWRELFSPNKWWIEPTGQPLVWAAPTVAWRDWVAEDAGRARRLVSAYHEAYEWLAEPANLQTAVDNYGELAAVTNQQQADVYKQWLAEGRIFLTRWDQETIDVQWEFLDLALTHGFIDRVPSKDTAALALTE